jgi:N-methylhydantoinase B
MKMDPIRFEVLRNAFEAAADEMGLALRRAAYSTNIKTRADFSCALFDADLRLIAQSFSQPVHLGSMSRMVPTAVRRFGPERLEPGDAIVMNHPYLGGVHLNDVAVIAPLFAAGRIAAYAAAIAHHVDIGGMAPGGYCMSTDLYQEGIIIPPIRIVSRGQMVEDVFNLLRENIRTPKQMAGDFRAQVGATLLGQQRMGEILDRFGADTVAAFVDELIDYTERWAQTEIAKLPEGDYADECFLDDDGTTGRPIRLCLRARVAGGTVAFDLSGSDAQRAAPMNATLTQSFSPLAYVIKCLIDPRVPTNDGFYRLISVTAPPGTVVNARPPVGVVGGWEVAMRYCDLCFRMFSRALPDRVMASAKGSIIHMAVGGRDPRDGGYYTFMETLGGGYGARPTRDGLDAVQAHFQNTENAAIEETENNLPFLITRYELVADSEGPGRFRGGLGLRRDWQFPDHEVTFTLLADNSKNAPWGLFGGGPGAPGRHVLNPDGEGRELPSKKTLRLNAGDVVSYRTPGGGGYGPALERDPQAVLGDVLDGKVSLSRAREVYGVVIDPDRREVDAAATEALRRQRGAAR